MESEKRQAKGTAVPRSSNSTRSASGAASGPRGLPITAEAGPAAQQRAVRNRLICGLNDDDRAALLDGVTPRHFARGALLLAPDQPIEHVVFPETMLASLVITMASGATAEVAAIGYEGVVGLSSLLGESTTWSAVCQVPGEGYLVPVNRFRRAADNPQFREALGFYTNALLCQMAQAVACNGLHSVERRAARWLLLSHDRTRRAEFSLTQEFLATMLGVSRPTVAGIGAEFARRGWAEFQRGVVTIHDPSGLEGVACECYGVMREEFHRMDRLADCSAR